MGKTFKDMKASKSLRENKNSHKKRMLPYKRENKNMMKLASNIIFLLYGGYPQESVKVQSPKTNQSYMKIYSTSIK